MFSTKPNQKYLRRWYRQGSSEDFVVEGRGELGVNGSKLLDFLEVGNLRVKLFELSPSS